ADAVGPTLYYGAGAGSEPTASAVVADIVDIARTLTADPENRVPHLAFQPNAIADIPVIAMEEVETAYYLRMQVTDKPGVMASVASILGDAGISIEAILQKEPAPGAEQASIILLTHVVQERQMNTAIRQIEALDTIHGDIMRIRLEHLDCD
ncbi:MAG: ACT domain-containing protein, partial [Gammaproteobacteria bacterium]